MAWHMTGTLYNPCSCKIGCPCALGETEADQGWCSAVLVLDIELGAVDGLSINGTKVALAADWPSGFLGGNGTGRLYFDTAIGQQQRDAVQSVLMGEKGGVPEAVLKALMTKMLPPKDAAINIQKNGDETRISVGSFGNAVVRAHRGPSGELTRLIHGATAIRDDVIWGDGRGTEWHDPELRQWQSAGHGEQSHLDWTA
jgi:hypothetical protein